MKKLNEIFLAILAAIIFSGCADKYIHVYDVAASTPFSLE